MSAKDLLPFWFLFSFITAFAQPQYEKDLLQKDFYTQRRIAFRKEMPEHSIALFAASPVRNRSNDVDFFYHQDPDFHYLCGFDEPDAIMIITSEPVELNGVKNNEFLFVKDKNPARELWTGHIAGTQEASSVTGISAVFSNTNFKDLQIPFASFEKILYIANKEDAFGEPRDVKHRQKLKEKQLKEEESLSDELSDKLASHKDLINEVPLAKAMARLRQNKLPEEIALVRKAVSMSCEAFNDMIRSIRPDMKEYQVQAMVECGFKLRGSEYVGYPSIVGSAENSCTLHYESNRKAFGNNDMMVCDAGAEYHGYSADVTRSLPVNGKFSKEQLAIYNLVLKAQAEAILRCKKGNEFQAPGKTAISIIKKGLLDLGITTKEEDYSIYFPHGTSHYIGLDVHDLGLYGNLEPGQIITVEPGIYIPSGSACDPKWWNIGIRIEDDILITDAGFENLSESTPRDPAVLEKMMERTPFSPTIK